jgi:hypothetical protein
VAELVDKRAFLAGRVCLTQGWYVHHAPHEVPGPGLQWRFYAGTEVGRLARVWLGEGKYLQRAPIEAALEATDAAVKNGESDLLFEASFSWGGLVARADALRRSDGGWTLIEVKSGKSSEDGKVKDEFLDDIAYTACVAIGAGLPVVRATLVLLNREYRLDGGAELLTELDVTGETLARASAFSTDAQAIAIAVGGDTRPEPSLKFACKDCEFFATVCVGKDIPDPLFVLPRLSAKRFEELRPYERISRIPAATKLTDAQRRVADVIRSGAPRAETAGLASLGSVTWPVHYLDFEAVAPHVPWFAESPPYDTHPFQYSLHIRSEPGAAPEHRSFLAGADGDWRRELTERMLADLGAAGSIVVYSSYEKTRLTALAKLFPDLRDALERVVARLFDLEKVFREGYTHPGFLGRTSIKKVLPVMVPDLSYDRLRVNNGADAAGVFGLMRVGEYPAETHAIHRERLLEYCELDTTAMVRLHEAVMRIREGAG